MSGFEDVNSKNLIFLISGGITMLFALLGLFVGLKRILDAIFDKNPNE